jgi:hypothetical protein
MLNLFHGKNEKNNDKEYLGEINTLHTYVSKTILVVQGIESDLSAEYSEEALSMISLQFEEISKKYSDFIIIVDHPFHEIIHRSKSRLSTIKRVIQQAKNVAQLFEKYARKPKSYSAANSRIQINKLCGELKNLKTYCNSNTGNN